ncbi:YesL family protein [Chengkuizengella sp. SCS-71B]|uniref:YesL family protein n=1 Tax=Chengkuizengella sp. SCS-71B TaxID=3115290 RepID=UPI0032C23A0B
METNGIMSGLYRVSEWIMRFSVINLLWLLCSLPVVFFVLTSLLMEETSQVIMNFIIIAIISPFTLFPATAAMFVVVRKWLTGAEDAPLFKTYFKGYKENYLQSMLGGFFYCILFTVMIVNIDFYNNYSNNLQFLSIFILILLVILIISLFYFFPLMVHLHLKLNVLLKNTFVLTIGKPLYSLGLALTNFLILYISFQYFTFLIVIFMGSAMAFCTYYYFNMLIQKIHSLEENSDSK